MEVCYFGTSRINGRPLKVKAECPLKNRLPVIEDRVRWIVDFFTTLIAAVFSIIVTVALGGVIVLLNAFVRGIVIVFVWSWFVSPTFSIRAISLGEAAGLYLVVNALLPSSIVQREETKSEYARKHPIIDASVKSIASMFLAPTFLLIIAWLWHTYRMNVSIPSALDFIPS